MTEKKAKPQIRFAGFSDTWEQRKLGMCFSERIENMPNGELISVTINDGIKKFSELGRHDNSNDDKSKYKKVCIGDIAYNSMRMWQGASGYSPYEGIVSPAYTVLSPNEDIYSKCIAYQFKLPQMIHTFQINSQGITSDNWNLKYPTLSKIDIYISESIQEQKKIAEFFTHLDTLITLHQRKLDKLTNVKKSMLEKMFPKNGANVPEIRFKGFTAPWEQRKVSDEMSDFIVPMRDKPKEFGGNIPWTRIEDIEGKYLNDSLSGQYVTEETVQKMNLKIIPKDSLIVSSSATFGTVAVVTTDLITNQTFIGLVPKEKDAIDYWYTYFQSHEAKKYMKLQSAGSTIFYIARESFECMPILIPSKNEMRKIGNFFTSLDNLITLHQRKLEKLKNIKKACLEKMFI